MGAQHGMAQVNAIDLLKLAGDAVGVWLAASRSHGIKPSGMGNDELEFQLFTKFGLVPALSGPILDQRRGNLRANRHHGDSAARQLLLTVGD